MFLLLPKRIFQLSSVIYNKDSDRIYIMLLSPFSTKQDFNWHNDDPLKLVFPKNSVSLCNSHLYQNVQKQKKNCNCFQWQVICISNTFLPPGMMFLRTVEMLQGDWRIEPPGVQSMYPGPTIFLNLLGLLFQRVELLKMLPPHAFIATVHTLFMM